MYLTKNYQHLQDWIKTDLGKYILQQEAKVLCNILHNTFVENILILGEPEFSLTDDQLLIDQNKLIHQFILHPRLNVNDQIAEQITKIVLLVSRYDQLPIDTDSMDVVILPHSLEMMSDPQQILSESHRVLRPEGKIIITGFNIFSVWWLYKLVAGIFIKVPWRNNFFSVSQLFGWLALLGFDEFKVVNYCSNLPINNQKFLNKFNFLEKFGNFFPFTIGNIYTINACKRVIPLTTHVLFNKWDHMPLDDQLAKNILKNERN